MHTEKATMVCIMGMAENFKTSLIECLSKVTLKSLDFLENSYKPSIIKPRSLKLDKIISYSYI